jgi:type VI secretion system protein ImpH
MNESDSDTEQLGWGTVVGDAIWDPQSRARLKLGPLTLAQYRSFLPDGEAFEPLRALVKFFSNDEMDFELQLVLQRDEVPRCEVGFEGAEAPRLGWVTWLKSASLPQNPEDTILQL